MQTLMVALETTQGPEISVDRGELNFGLVPHGQSSSLKLCINNESNSTAKLCFKQLVQTREGGFVVSKTSIAVVNYCGVIMY